ncbi:MAG: hypothetical protein JWM56_524 [Candidatus Peribacteria bacterium]|nr:hypothetical protein [Candidatus Peribacteria bacterium]
MNSHYGTILAGLVTVCLVSCSEADVATTKTGTSLAPNWHTEKLATLSVADDTYDHRIIFSPDGNHVAYVEVKNGQERMVVDEKPGKWHGKIIWDNYQYQQNTDPLNHVLDRFRSSPFFTADGIIVYRACEGKNLDSQCREGELNPEDEEDNRPISHDQKVIVGTNEGESYPLIEWISASEDGRTIAYRAFKKSLLPFVDPSVIVVNGTEQKDAFDEIGDPTVSADGKKIAYRARKGEQAFIVENGVQGKSFRFLSNPFYNPTSTDLVYFAVQNGLSLIVNDREWPVSFPYPGTGDAPPIFSNDGTTLGFTGKGMITLNLKTGHLQQFAEDNDTYYPVISPNGLKVAYMVEGGNGQYFTLNGIKDPHEHNRIVDIAFSSDSRRIAYTVQLVSIETSTGNSGNDMQMVIDGKPEEAYQYVGSPLFSPDSKNIAYAVRTGSGADTYGLSDSQMFIKFNDKNMKAYRSVGSPVFSQDGKHFAYVAGRGIKEVPQRDEERQISSTLNMNAETLVVIDGREGASYDEIFGTPVFSPDGKLVAYAARRGSDLMWVVDNIAQRL